MEIVSIGEIITILEWFLVFPKDIKEQFARQLKNNRVILIPPIQIIAHYNDISFELRYDNEIEEIGDNEQALERMWDFVFLESILPEGRVLFYPSLFDLQEKAGIICNTKELKDFLFSRYFSVFGNMPNVSMGDFYFIFIDSLVFFVFEHPGICYSFGLKNIKPN